MWAICMNCENAFIKDGPYSTCAKCQGPCDTFRQDELNTCIDSGQFQVENSAEAYANQEYSRNTEQNTDGEEKEKCDKQLFRRKVPQLWKLKSLKKADSADRSGSFGFRLLRLCSTYANPYTWLQTLRESKNRSYIEKSREENSDECQAEKNDDCKGESQLESHAEDQDKCLAESKNDLQVDNADESQAETKVENQSESKNECESGVKDEFQSEIRDECQSQTKDECQAENEDECKVEISQ